jgi:peptidoglycan/xylan/chitin deacetylase (PgdA/CDA1 family)
MSKPKVAYNYNELKNLYNYRLQLHAWLRNTAVFSMSLYSKIDSKNEWIRFPNYHHIFNDERKDFARQIKYLINYGDFISLDNAVNIISRNTRIGGRYFCLTFDDGFKNHYTNALPILVEHGYPGAFFVPTDYIGRDINKDREIVQSFFKNTQYPLIIEFMSWDNCRELINAGMVIGSHTCSHAKLSTMEACDAKTELLNSKLKIENKLGIVCRHFSAPFGTSGKHFLKDLHPKIAQEVGYCSFFTAERGANLQGTNPFNIRRDTLLARWGNYQLRYLFS